MLRRPQLLILLSYQPPWAVLLDQPESAERDGPGETVGPCIVRHGSGPLNVPPGNWITHGPKPRDMRANESSNCRC